RSRHFTSCPCSCRASLRKSVKSALSSMSRILATGNLPGLRGCRWQLAVVNLQSASCHLQERGALDPPMNDFRQLSCPLPLTTSENVLLGHGSGGRVTADLIPQVFLPPFSNPLPSALEDQAKAPPPPGNRPPPAFPP